jgi:tricorn protease
LPVFAQQTLLLQQPAISADHLAFVYAGDLWIADADGSAPRRLTSHPADEGNPTFSPDGSLIAFSANYENNVDVYVIDVSGGQPRRLTWHPVADAPTGWTADGSAVAFVSTRETDHGRSGQLYLASLDGGLPQKQMQARVYRGAYDASGSRFAYIAFGSGYNGLFGGTAGWRGYRGGTTPAIAIMDMDAQSVTTVPGAGATNFNPIWLGDGLYFISDRNDKRFNVHRYDLDSGAIEQVSDEQSWDVRSASGFGSEIVYEAGGRLWRLNTDSGAASEIVISINPDLPQLRTQWKDASDIVQGIDISPSGKRAIITARGEVFTVPVDEGSTRNLTDTGGTREYSALWSPGGEQVAYITEAEDGQALVVADQTGIGEPEVFELGPHFYDLMAWTSGDAERIVFQDNHLTLYVIDLGNGRIAEIAAGARREAVDVAVSTDGRWLAYTQERPNFQRDLMLYDFESGDDFAVTNGTVDAAAPAFSRDGSFLYFAASTNSGPLQSGLDMTSRERPYRAGLYAAVLAADGESPLLPGSGDEAPEESEGGDDESSDVEDEDESQQQAVTEIDIAGLSSRVVALPVAERNYGNLAVADGGDLYYVQYVQPGASNVPPGENERSENVLMKFDFEGRKASEVLDSIDGFRIGQDGMHMIVARVDGSLAVAEIADPLEPESLSLDGLRVRVDPRDEWAQIFNEAWRMEAEFFYDPNMHGLDWDAVYEQYRPLVEHVGRREDLSELIVQMIAEMQVGHNRAGGGDIYREAGAATGVLGANLVIENDRYRIARIYTGEAWNPFLTAPLAVPGDEASEGEYILAVDGQELTGDDNIFEYLQGTVGKQVRLRVGPEADGDDARDIVVEPTEFNRLLRLWSWIESNRRIVDEATDGRVGYVYLPDTADFGYTFFNRMFFAQIDREAMIVDERSNSGGQAANYITDVLSRRHLSGWKDRDGLTFNTPAGAMHGPKLMMIDQDAGSGGDYLPYAFRELGIGKLLGKRTWGGLIGISANPSLIDGGALVVPFFRFFDADGNWAIENEGVTPDIDVALDPIAANEGRDTQLERAIEEILTELERSPSTVPTQAPPYPTVLGE